MTISKFPSCNTPSPCIQICTYWEGAGLDCFGAPIALCSATCRLRSIACQKLGHTLVYPLYWAGMQPLLLYALCEQYATVCDQACASAASSLGNAHMKHLLDRQRCRIVTNRSKPCELPLAVNRSNTKAHGLYGEQGAACTEGMADSERLLHLCTQTLLHWPPMCCVLTSKLHFPSSLKEVDWQPLHQ